MIFPLTYNINFGYRLTQASFCNPIYFKETTCLAATIGPASGSDTIFVGI
jgi:hypothetical protein